MNGWYGPSLKTAQVVIFQWPLQSQEHPQARRPDPVAAPRPSDQAVSDNVQPEEVEAILENVEDSDLKQTLVFGIGMHHAGLTSEDRRIVEGLFVEGLIQVIVATSTLAWGVNFPAKLVIVKGTEFFDPKSKKYVE